MTVATPTRDAQVPPMTWHLLAVRALGVLLIGLCLRGSLDVAVRIIEGLQWAEDQKHPSGLFYLMIDYVFERLTLVDGVQIGVQVAGLTLGVLLVIPSSGNFVCRTIRRWT